MITFWRSLTFGLAGAALLAGACAPAAAPQPPAAPPAVGAPSPTPAGPPFYAGKTIRIIAGYAAGGGYDAYARLLAKYIGKHIPGNPTAVVENMVGAGSLIAANNLYKVAKPDGLTFGTFGEGLVLQQALGNKDVEFDGRKFAWLGAADQSTIACAVKTSRGMKTISDAVGSSQPLILGATAVGSNTYDFPRALEAALGANIKIVAGYGGTSDMRLAAERGEVEGGCWTWESIKVTWKEAVESGDVAILVQQRATKAPDLPNVPLATELAKTDEARQILNAVTSPSFMTKPFATHPDTPADRVKLLRDGIAAAFKDKELIAEAAKAKLEVNPVTAAEVEKIVADLLATPPDVAKKLEQILQ